MQVKHYKNQAKSLRKRNELRRVFEKEVPFK